MSAIRRAIDIDAPRVSLRMWLVAASAAFLIHAACVALAVTRMQSDEDSDALGAPAIEIGLEMMSPRVEATDLPPGPDAEASAASPAVTEQQAVVKDTDLPKAIPTETEEPDRIVTPNDSKKPKEEEAETAVVQAESVASEATAMPSTEAIQEGPKSVAPAQGTGQAAMRQRVAWQKELVAHLDKHKRYPVERSQKSAEIIVQFVLDRVGHVQQGAIVKGSGDAAFDEAALAMVRRSDPVPAPPPLIADEGLSFTLPVIFRVKGKG